MIKIDDQAWFCQQVSEIKQTMFRIAYSILRNNHDCEDAASNAILNAYRNLPRLKNRAVFKPWLIKILKNECYAILRKNKRVAVLEEDFAGEQNTENINLQLAISRLTEDNRIAVILYYLEGYSIQEISSILNVPDGTTKSRLSRSRIKLKQLMEE